VVAGARYRVQCEYTQCHRAPQGRFQSLEGVEVGGRSVGIKTGPLPRKKQRPSPKHLNAARTGQVNPQLQGQVCSQSGARESPPESMQLAQHQRARRLASPKARGSPSQGLTTAHWRLRDMAVVYLVPARPHAPRPRTTSIMEFGFSAELLPFPRRACAMRLQAGDCGWGLHVCPFLL
jgi:hypothetical protein